MTHFITILKGAAIGVATLIPGVSGGTMAIILGMYDFMIEGISNFLKEWKKYTLPFVELGVGALGGILMLSPVIGKLLERYEILMQFLFMGIILGGLPALLRKSAEFWPKKGKTVYFLVGVLLVLLTGLTPHSIFTVRAEVSMAQVMLLFLGGGVLAIALVLPGISASFLLLILGLYRPALQAIQYGDMTFLVPLGMGVISGIFASAKIIRHFLIKYPGQVYMLIVGFVVGSLFELCPPLHVLLPGILLPSVIMAATGFCATYLLSGCVGEA